MLSHYVAVGKAKREGEREKGRRRGRNRQAELKTQPWTETTGAQSLTFLASDGYALPSWLEFRKIAALKEIKTSREAEKMWASLFSSL